MDDSISFGESGIVRVAIRILLGPTGSNAFRLGESRLKLGGSIDFLVGVAADDTVDEAETCGVVDSVERTLFASDLRRDAFDFFISAADVFLFLCDFDFEVGVEGIVEIQSDH